MLGDMRRNVKGHQKQRVSVTLNFSENTNEKFQFWSLPRTSVAGQTDAMNRLSLISSLHLSMNRMNGSCEGLTAFNNKSS